METSPALRSELERILTQAVTHTQFDEVVTDFPPHLRGVRPQGTAHSAWEVLEHLRIANWDMLEFSRDPSHQSPPWPSGYWPASSEPPTATAWDDSIATVRRDLNAMCELIRDPKSDLLAALPHGDGQSASARSAADRRSQLLAHERTPDAEEIFGLLEIGPVYFWTKALAKPSVFSLAFASATWLI